MSWRNLSSHEAVVWIGWRRGRGLAAAVSCCCRRKAEDEPVVFVGRCGARSRAWSSRGRESQKDWIALRL